MSDFSKLENVSAMPRDGFALSDLRSYVFKLFGVSRGNAGVTGVALVSADTREPRTQGGQIAELFGRLRTPDHAVLATTNGMTVGTGVPFGTLVGGAVMRLLKGFVAFVIVLMGFFLVVVASAAGAAKEFEKYALESVSTELLSFQAGVYADFNISAESLDPVYGKNG